MTLWVGGCRVERDRNAWDPNKGQLLPGTPQGLLLSLEGGGRGRHGIGDRRAASALRARVGPTSLSSLGHWRARSWATDRFSWWNIIHQRNLELGGGENMAHGLDQAHHLPREPEAQGDSPFQSGQVQWLGVGQVSCPMK